MRKINIRNVSEELSTDTYYEKISRLANSSINLEEELERKFGFPTSQDELSKLIKEWFDYQDYSDDEQAFDYAIAYYLSEYGNDNTFRNALEDVIDNMEANGYTEISESINSEEIERQLKAIEKVLPNIIISSYKLPFVITFSSLPGNSSLRMEFKENSTNDDIKFDVKSIVPDYHTDGLCDDIDLYYMITDIYNEFADTTGAVEKINIPTYSGINESKNRRNKYKTRKTFENFRNMKKNKKVTYRVNENSQRKRFKRLPMFENYLEEKYDSVKLLDGHKYVLTDDVVVDDGQVLAKKGDTVTYEDVVGVFSNNATEFTTDCGVFRTEDGQALCPEILMSQGLVSDPQSKMTEDPKAFMAEVVAECRKVGQKLSKAAAARKKIYESLTDEQKKKYQAKKDKLTQEQIEKYNKEIDDMEEKALKIQEKGESGEISEEEMLNKIDRLTKSALEKYRIVTGGEDPAWYEDYMDEPGFGKANECDNSTILLSENADKADDILKFCADNGFELTKQQLEDNHVDVEVAVDPEGSYVDFRVYDPNSSVSSGYKNADGWTNWMLDNYQPVNEEDKDSQQATETEVEEIVNDDILTPETVEAVLTADDDVKDETVEVVVDAVKDDAKEGEEISLDDVVDATVDAELSKEDATTVIDAVVDAVVDQKVEEETVNESKKRSLKKAVKESLHKKFRKGVFEARVMKIRNKKK